MAPILIDTNLLIYLYDQNQPSKQARAIELLDQLELAGIGRLSVQNLAEFFSVSTRKLSPPLSPAEALAQVNLFTRAWLVFDLTPLIVLEAGRGVRDYQMSYYDAQIWATARLNQISVIFSEDFNVGATLEGVQFVNPFAPEFVLDAWV
ncbi:MAG TPA: PIN domain-containing protein [candidate division Zixibacteria bacterium]|nr:PIN domain-containing protein [candidate division Zixibacteria bacterium]